jgi:hypothetical protein
MAVTILAITTWAASSNPESDSAAPIPPIPVSTLEFVLKGRQAARGMNVGWIELRPRATRIYAVAVAAALIEAFKGGGHARSGQLLGAQRGRAKGVRPSDGVDEP